MQKQKGFTIIELIVVIAIIAVLAAIVTTNVMGYMKKARNAARISDVENYVKALTMYYADNSKYPNEADGPPTSCCLGDYHTAESGTSQCGGAGRTNQVCSNGTNNALATYFPGLPGGGATGLFESSWNEWVHGYFYSNPGLGVPGSLFTIHYALEGQSQKCGVGTYLGTGTDATYCKYIQY